MPRWWTPYFVVCSTTALHRSRFLLASFVGKTLLSYSGERFQIDQSAQDHSGTVTTKNNQGGVPTGRPRTGGSLARSLVEDSEELHRVQSCLPWLEWCTDIALLLLLLRSVVCPCACARVVVLSPPLRWIPLCGREAALLRGRGGGSLEGSLQSNGSLRDGDHP